MLKGHLRNVTLSAEYNDQILPLFLHSIYQDEEQYEGKKAELIRMPTARGVGRLEEYYNHTFHSTVKARYKLDLPPLIIPEEWENGQSSFQFPQACIKTALVANLIQSFPAARIDEAELFKLKDYEIWQYIDGETAASGGNRSYLSTFCTLVNQIFIEYIHNTFTAKGEDLQVRLSQKHEFVRLYLAYKLGECNGALIALRSFARRITCRLEQKEDSVRSTSISKRPSSVVLDLSHFEMDEEKSQRSQSGSKIQIKIQEESKVETPRGKEVLEASFFNFSRYSFPLQLTPEMLNRLPSKIDEDCFHLAWDLAISYRTTLLNLKKTIQEILDLFVILYPLEVPEAVTPEVRKLFGHLNLIKHYSNMQVNCITNQMNFLKEIK